MKIETNRHVLSSLERRSPRAIGAALFAELMFNAAPANAQAIASESAGAAFGRNLGGTQYKEYSVASPIVPGGFNTSSASRQIGLRLGSVSTDQ